MRAGFADDLTIYAALLTALKVLAELRLRLGEDTNLRYNMGKLKIYIPGVTRDRARELVLKFINQDPSLESLRELYDKDIAEPDLNIINVTGMTCVGVPMGSPEFVTAFVRSKAKILQQDVQKLRIVPDPLIHYTLLRFCQHTRLAFLARNVPPAILMQPVDVNFDPASGVRTSPVAVPVFIQDLIVSAILQRGLGATYDTLPAHILSWCRTIVELPHHEGGLGITPLPASGMAAFYSATANLVSWLGSLPHASQWVAGQTLDDPTTWTCSALSTLKQLHDNLLTLYNCSEWAPPPPAGPAAAPAPDAPAQGHDADNAHPLSLPPLIFSLLCVLGRMRKMVRTLFVHRYLRNARSLNGSCNNGRCTSLCSEILLRTACVMCTCCIVPNRCPCLMSIPPCAATCRNAMTTRVASQHASPFPPPPQCGA